MVLVALIVGGVIWSLVLASFFGFGAGILGGILTVVALFLIGHGLFGVGLKSVPIPRIASGSIGVVLLLVVIFGVGGLMSGIGAVSAPAASVTSQPLLPSSQQPTSVSVDQACANSVSDNVRGTSATLTLNAYDYANQNPLGTNVDTAYSVYAAKDISGTNQASFRSTGTDSTTGTVTTTKVGELVSIFGNGGVNYYVLPQEGVCVDGQQKPVNLVSYNITTDGNIAGSLFDSNGNALSSGNSATDRTFAMAANEKVTIQWELKENSANTAFYLSALGFATGTNITSVEPTGNSKGLFTQVFTPQHMKDLSIEANLTGDGNRTLSYSVWKLNTPVLLKEFEKVKYDLKVTASGSDPLGAAGTATMSGIWGIAKDGTWVRDPLTGSVVFDIQDRTTSQADTGMNEIDNMPCGLTTGFCADIS